MSQRVEEAIVTQIREMSRATLRDLHEALLRARFVIPLFSELGKDAQGRIDVPVSCIRLPDGENCIPAFTSVPRLLEWKPTGSLYAEMPGDELFKMASGMPEIDCVYVNYSEKQGTPKGKVTRPEFESLARGTLPEDA